MKRWYKQQAELLFEHSDDDNKEYLVGVYIPAFDPELGSAQSLESAIKDFTENGIVIKGRNVKDLVEMFKP
jgi:hypothetical protein